MPEQCFSNLGACCHIWESHKIYIVNNFYGLMYPKSEILEFLDKALAIKLNAQNEKLLVHFNIIKM